MHELCEELVISSPNRQGDVLNTVVFRGPRLKTGVDTGQVLGEVHAMTGRMTYRGKVMNRAARVASTASTGQVLCSADAWELVKSKDLAALEACKVTASSLGQFRLKGVAERIEIYHCRKASTGQRPNRRGNSMVVNITERWNWENGNLEGQTAPPNDHVVNGQLFGMALPARLSVNNENESVFMAAAKQEADPVDGPEEEEEEEADEATEDDEVLGGDPYVLAGPPEASTYVIPTSRP